MSTLSETIFEQYATPPENKALEDMQTDVQDLSRKVSSFAMDAAEILASEPVAPHGRSAKVSLLTKQLFGVVALVTLALNVGLHFVNASLGQMVVANLGISVLHVLVSMCVVSDLAKGKTHFQNKREQILERIQTVSEYLRELMHDRQQWVNAVSEVKWLLENEQIKLKMAKLEVSSQQDKLDFTLSLLAERTATLEGLEEEQLVLTRSNANMVDQNRQLMDDLQIVGQDLEAKERNKIQVDEEIAKLKELENVARIRMDEATRERDSQETKLAEKLQALMELQDNLQFVSEEWERMSERLAETTNKVGENEALHQQLHQAIAKLTLEVEEKEIAVQANCNKSVELLTLYETLEVEKKDLVASIDAAKQELEKTEQQCKVANETSQMLEIQVQKMQQENIELINRTVQLESQSANQTERLVSGEAQLRSLEEMRKTKEATVQELQMELVQVERCVANLMQQLGELECLSVAKCVSEQLTTRADTAVSGIQPIPLLKDELPAEPCAACLQHQLDAENRKGAEAMLAELESRQAVATLALDESLQAADDATKQVADAEQRVEMLARKANGLSDQVQERSAELYGLKQELIVTRAEVRELEVAKQQLILAEQELLSLQARVELNHAEFTNLQTQMTEFERVHQDKVNSARDLDRELSELQFQIDLARSEINASNCELEGLRTTKIELEHTCALLDEQSVRALKEKTDVNHELTRLQEAMESARIDLQNLAEQRDQQALELEDLSRDVDLRREQLSEIELEVRELSVREQAHDDLQLEIEDALEHLENLRKEGASAASEAQERQQLVVASEKRIQELALELKALEEESAGAAERLKSITDEVADAQSVSQQWQSYLTSLQADMKVHSDCKASLEKELELLQSQVGDVRLRTQEVGDSLEAIQRDRQLAQEQFDREDLRLKAIQMEVEEAMSKRNSYVSQQSEAQRILENLQGELSQTEQVLACTVLQWEQEQARIVEGQSQRAELEAILLELQADQARFTSEVNTLTSESESLTNCNEASREMFERLEREVASLEMVKADLQQIEADYNERRSEVERFETELSDLHAKCHQLQSEIQELETKNSELAQLQHACESKQSSLLVLQTEYDDKLRMHQEIDAEIACMKCTHEDLVRLQNECDKKVENLLQMENDLKTHESALLTMSKETDTKICELREIHDSLGAKKLQLEDLDENIARKSLESDELVHQLDQSRREIGKLAAFRKSTEATIGELMQQVDSLQEAVSDCHRALEQAKMSKAEMDQKLTSVETQIQSRMKDQAQLTHETKLANVELESKKSELTDLRSQIAKYEKDSIAWMESVRRIEIDYQLVNLELEAKRIESSAVILEAIPEPVQQSEFQVESQVESQVAIAAEANSMEEELGTKQNEMSTNVAEEDVWNSLNELTQLGKSVRVESVTVETEPKSDGLASISGSLNTLQPRSKPRADAWASIFSDNS